MNLCRSGVIERFRVLQFHLKNVTPIGGQRIQTPGTKLKPLRYISQSSNTVNRTGPILSAYDVAHIKTGDDNELDVTYPLTKSEAIPFLEQVLKIPNAETFCQENKIAFLNTVTERMNKALPFSNVVLLGRERDLRVAPSLEECKQEVRELRGGSCFIVNTFNKAMLELMGFTCHLIPGSDPISKYNDTHIGLMVVDLRYPGSRDIVEAGTRRPLFEAIPLDFKEESPEYQCGHFRSKYFWKDKHVIWCKELEKNSQKTKNVILSGGKKWEKQMIYDVNTLLHFPLIVRMNSVVWPSAQIVPEVHGHVMVTGYSGLDFVSIRGKYISIIDENLRERTKIAKSKAELLEIFQKYFPQFTRDMVIKAIDNTIHSW